MRALLIRWLGVSVAVMLLALYPGSGLRVETPLAALLAIGLWGLLNALVKPFLALFRMATCLVHALTLGLSTLLVALAVNIMIFLYIGYEKPIQGFSVSSPEAAIRAALLLSVVNAVLSHWVKDDGDDDRRRR